MKTLSKALLSVAVVGILGACGQSASNNNAYQHTGSVLFESELSNLSKSEVQEGVELYVTASALRVRSTPDTASDENILGELGRNDRVKVVGQPDDVFVEIEILDSESDIQESAKYYTAYAYLAKQSQAPKSQELSEYFMIQNLATEKLRVYKRGCEDGDCAHKMIFETDIAVGEDDSGTRSILGHFKITSWHKFYQDGAGNYPSWYDPKYPNMPKPGSGAMAWTSSKVLPYSSASVRGAFGWYTAKVGPDSSYQWTHGTIGWGADKKDYIEATRGFWANLFADPRSHGCTRTDNESIAYIRQLLPVGATVIKVYAREGLSDPNLHNYYEEEGKWDYILTKSGVRVDGQKADRSEVLSAGTSYSQFLEEGTLTLDKYPTPKVFLSGGSGSRTNSNGNYYGLEHEDMTGVFLVDEGRLWNYQHPSRKLRVGGFKDVLFPEGVISYSPDSVSLPACPKKYLPMSKKQRRSIDSRGRRDAGRCAPTLNLQGRYVAGN